MQTGGEPCWDNLQHRPMLRNNRPYPMPVALRDCHLRRKKHVQNALSNPCSELKKCKTMLVQFVITQMGAVEIECQDTVCKNTSPLPPMPARPPRPTILACRDISGGSFQWGYGNNGTLPSRQKPPPFTNLLGCACKPEPIR